MISLVDCAMGAVIALCVGVLVSEFSRSRGTRPESEHKSKQNAGPLWYFVPYQERDRRVAPCISYRAREYARRFRN